MNPAVQADQTRRLAALRARRDNARVHTLLDTLEAEARGDSNLMPTPSGSGCRLRHPG